LAAFAAEFVVLPAWFFLSTSLMTPTAIVCFISLLLELIVNSTYTLQSLLLLEFLLSFAFLLLLFTFLGGLLLLLLYLLSTLAAGLGVDGSSDIHGAGWS
jgi:hypothetical protein